MRAQQFRVKTPTQGTVPPKMDLHIDIELEGEILLVTATGSAAYDAALRLLKQVFDTAAEKQVNKILVNNLSVEGDLSPLARYHLGVQVAEYLKQRKMNPRLAVVGKPPTTNGVAVGIIRNREVTGEVFSSVQDALEWLNKWPV
jgi:hypothetical protein